MRVLERLDWLAKCFHSRDQQSNYVIPSLIQPTVDVSTTWPLNYVYDRRTGTLSAGTNSFAFYPGQALTPTSYPNTNRHHCRFIFARVDPGASLACNVTVMRSVPGASDQAVDRVYNASAATIHYPLVGVLPDRRYCTYPYYFQIQITSAAGTESYDLRVVRLDSLESCPIRP